MTDDVLGTKSRATPVTASGTDTTPSTSDTS
jgi:hypothetical protein